MLTQKAHLVTRLHQECATPEQHVALLKKEYATEVLDESMVDGEPTVRKRALQSMLAERGVDTDALMAGAFGSIESRNTPRVSDTRPQDLSSRFKAVVSPSDDISRRLQNAELELAALKLSKETGSLAAGQPGAGLTGAAAMDSGLCAVLGRQVVAITALTENKAASTHRRSTIQVQPRVNWPKLGDTGPGGKEVEEFY